MPFNPEKLRFRQVKAAEGYLALSMPDHALRELDEISDVGNDQYRISMLKGEALQAKREHRLALDEFRLAHLDRPTDLHAMMGMAWCFKRIDQLHNAIDTMKLAYQFHKEIPVVLYNLACYYALAGEKENALSWLGRSLRMDRSLLDELQDETDFDSLRTDADFQHLIQLTSNHNH